MENTQIQWAINKNVSCALNSFGFGVNCMVKQKNFALKTETENYFSHFNFFSLRCATIIFVHFKTLLSLFNFFFITSIIHLSIELLASFFFLFNLFTSLFCLDNSFDFPIALFVYFSFCFIFIFAVVIFSLL